jgi:hypothetical protein
MLHFFWNVLLGYLYLVGSFVGMFIYAKLYIYAGAKLGAWMKARPARVWAGSRRAGGAGAFPAALGKRA